MKFIPAGDRLLVRPVEPPAFTPGGLTIPDSAKGEEQEGVVVSTGTLPSLKIYADRRVVFGKYAGKPIKIDGVAMLILKEEELLGYYDIKES